MDLARRFDTGLTNIRFDARQIDLNSSSDPNESLESNGFISTGDVRIVCVDEKPTCRAMIERLDRWLLCYDPRRSVFACPSPRVWSTPAYGRMSAGFRCLFFALRYVTPSIARFVSLEVRAIDTF